MKENRKLIIGISSRALFNLDESHDIYEKDGLDSYRDYQIANEDKTLEPGEEVKMPVSFYVDPSINDDENTKNLKEITLSYTFYNAD